VTGDKIVCEFESVQFEPTDEREFTMGFYGLPELSSVARQSRLGNVYWMIGISLLGIVIAFGLRWASKRLRPKLSSA
jgi:hypothetical protein